MKWRLSKDKDNAGLQKKSMPYSDQSREIIDDNTTTPINLAEISADQQRYKFNSSSRNNDDGRRFSFREAMKQSNNSQKHDNMQSMYVMAPNHLTKGEPWMTSASAQMTKSARGSAPANHHHHHHSNLNPTMLDNYNGETNNDFHYINATRNPSNTGSSLQNGSTTKLIPMTDDQPTKQTKCSIFRGLLLCLCLSVTYANIVRFPRELEKYGCAFLVPYFVFIFLVGLPIILLEVSIGQFLGQGAGSSWRASPIMKGACIVGRMASCLGAIWVSLEAVIALVYIVLITYKKIPFNECVQGVKISEIGYSQRVLSGGDCLNETIFTPVWNYAFYFALLASGLAAIWIVSVICSHNAKIFRRITFFTGLLTFALLVATTGWEIDRTLRKTGFPEWWIFNENLFAESTIWFDGLIQVLFGTYIGFGALPVMTGCFLYKGDAVRTSIVYICFNLLINAIGVILFMIQFDNDISKVSTIYPELKPLTAIYEKALTEVGLFETRILPALIYGLVVLSAIITTTIAVYSVSKLLPRHTIYILGLVTLCLSVVALFCPEYMVARVLDSRIVGTLIIIALVFDIIATTWIYGGKNIYLDLEFAIGRPIFKHWVGFWYIAPAILTGILVWWCVGDDQLDLLSIYIPRWAPIILALIVIVGAAIAEISKQVDYNFFGMICEAAKAAKEWGPADPLARHAWKQWRAVCQDTGRKDFTLRRRGTRDYTNSIKRGQYSTNKYNVNNWKNSPTGTSSPNYSGSMFGDSAIEEDLSVGKYSGMHQQFGAHGTDNNGIKPTRHSSRSRYTSRDKPSSHGSDTNHKEILYVRRLSTDSNNKTTITITPTADIVTYPSDQTRGRTSSNMSPHVDSRMDRHAHHHHDVDGDHICWRKFSVNSEEYSTEL